MRRRDSSVFFTEKGFALSLAGGTREAPRSWNLQANLVGAKDVAPLAEQPKQAVQHHYVGAPSNWQTAIPTYGQVAWEEIQSGIDMAAEPTRDGFEYRFIVSPGAKPEQLAIDWSGAKEIRATDDGRGFEIASELGVLRASGLRAFAIENGTSRELRARHVIDGTRVSFAVDGWNGAVPLVIDPTIAWSSYLGGASSDQASSIAVDGSGNAFVTGYLGASTVDAFVSKVSATGTLLWTTNVGGGGDEFGYGIAVDGSGNALVTGYTTSNDFPSTGGFATTRIGGQDAFVTKVSGAGAIVWSSYLGGSADDTGYGIAVDGSGNAFVTGQTLSSNFPKTGGFDTTLGGTSDAFVTKVSAAGALLWSSYLGGVATERGLGIAVDGSGNAFATGFTASSDFPSSGGFDTTVGGFRDAYLTKVSGVGAVLWSSYLGGAGTEIGRAVAIDGSGNVFVTGNTDSSDFPSTGGFDTTLGGSYDGFVTKVSGAGSVLWSSYFGGADQDDAYGIALDGSGNVFIAGVTVSTDFPSSGGFDTTLGGIEDAIVMSVTEAGVLNWSSYLGGTSYDWGYGIAVDGSGNAWVTGTTDSTDFPSSGGFDTSLGGTEDAFITKISSMALGASCSSAGDCVSTFCVDGVCCATACTGTCQACSAAKKGSGTNGTCGSIADGTNPDSECAAQSCAAGTVTKAQVCNGAGACRSNGTVSCGAYACTGTACATTCASDGNCASTAYCAAMACAPKKTNGTTCSTAHECTSGTCADGVCCDAACSGQCEACNVSGSVGTCVAVTGAPKGTRSPCTGDPAVCGGACDGAKRDACVYAPITKSCGATCAMAVETSSTCDGAGTCVSGAPHACGAYVCADATACATSCSSGSSCATGNHCTGGSCVPDTVDAGTDAPTDTGITDTGMPDTAVADTAVPDTAVADTAVPDTAMPETPPSVTATDPKEKPVAKGDAQACTSASECVSGFCVDGVCCDSACEGTCRSCALPQAPGKCSLQPLGYDMRRQCSADTACRSTCGGDGTCVPAFAGARCEQPKCTSATTATGYAVCSGLEGTCLRDQALPFDCAPYICEAALGACRDSCRTSSDCAAGSVCDTITARCIVPPEQDSGGCALSSRPVRGSASALVGLVIAFAAVSRRRRQAR